MPDWIEVVNSRLGPLGLDPQREAEIIAELAAHVEDLYDDFRRQCLSEDEATQLALASVSDWPGLRKKIRSVEKNGSPMSNFRKRVWLPGVYSVGIFFLWGLVIAALLARVLLPRFVQSPDWRVGACFWCVTFMGLGAAAAYWSRRAGGSRRERIEAALFFPAAHTIFSIMGLVIRSVLGMEVLPLYFGRFVLIGILFPAAALLLGTLPFLKGDSGKSVDGTARDASQKASNSSSTPNHRMLFLGLWTRQRGTARA